RLRTLRETECITDKTSVFGLSCWRRYLANEVLCFDRRNTGGASGTHFVTSATSGSILWCVSRTRHATH
ncbi:MAG: hypothetical protein WD070_09730, partial [Pirellulaceae bacterium]